MGKTFVALAVAASVALARPDDGPIVVMVPSSLKDKWPKDWQVFREHCLQGEARERLGEPAGRAESGVDLLRLLDDVAERRKAIIFLTHGGLNRSLTDEWVKLALIRRALLRRTSMGSMFGGPSHDSQAGSSGLSGWTIAPRSSGTASWSTHFTSGAAS